MPGTPKLKVKLKTIIQEKLRSWEEMEVAKKGAYEQLSALCDA